MIKAGVYKTLSNEDYHGDKESVSRSGLMDFAISPFHYWANHINPNRPKKERTPQQELGAAFHLLMLEPHLFDKTYKVEPTRVLLKDVGKEKYYEYKAICDELAKDGYIILTNEQMDILTTMKAVFIKNNTAVSLLFDGRIEHSFIWQDNHSGLILKARPDVLHLNMIVDIKTCNDASPRGFQNSMAAFGNHIQGAMIRDGVEELEGNRINKVINILIETKYPYAMGIYFIDEVALDAGHTKYKQLCLDMKACIETNEWPDYGCQTIGLPKWALI